MFRTILVTSCLLITIDAVAQNWEVFPTGHRNVYISTDQNDSHYVYAYNADSFKVSGTDTVFFFNQKPFDGSDPYCYSHFSSNYDFSLYHDPFIMDSILRTGNHYEINIAGTIVQFFHQANVNESWKVNAAPFASWIDSTRISCTSASEELIFGISDSVKTFSLTAYNGGQVIPEFSSYQYKLSKSFGFVEFIPFRSLVLNDYVQEGLEKLSLQRMEAGGQVYGFSFPTFGDYFSHYQPGDVLSWNNIIEWFTVMDPTTGALYRDSLISVDQAADSVCMCIYRDEKKFTVGLTDTVFQAFILSRCFYKNQFEPFLQMASGQFTFAANDFGTTYGPIGAWQIAKVEIDSNAIAPVFSVFAHYGYYLDSFTCLVGITFDYGSAFKINTSEGLCFYAEYSIYFDTTGLTGYTLGSGIAGDCPTFGVNAELIDEGAQFSVIPTLATDFIRIQSSGIEELIMELYSAEGNLLLRTKKKPGDNLDIRFLPDGFYIIRVFIEQGTMTSKFMKHSPD